MPRLVAVAMTMSAATNNEWGSTSTKMGVGDSTRPPNFVNKQHKGRELWPAGWSSRDGKS